MKVSLNGEPSREVESVVIFDGDTPIALAISDEDSVLFADALRDKTEFTKALRELDVPEKEITIINYSDLKQL